MIEKLRNAVDFRTALTIGAGIFSALFAYRLLMWFDEWWAEQSWTTNHGWLLWIAGASSLLGAPLAVRQLWRKGYRKTVKRTLAICVAGGAAACAFQIYTARIQAQREAQAAADFQRRAAEDRRRCESFLGTHPEYKGNIYDCLLDAHPGNGPLIPSSPSTPRDTSP